MNYIGDYDLIVDQDKIIYRRHNSKKPTSFFLSENELNNGVIINFPYDSYYHSYKSKIYKIPENKTFSRAGVIPYTIKKGVKYYCMGYDAKYGTLTDFGGGVKKNENFLLAACRELYEESLGLFNFTTKSDMKAIYNNSTIVYDDKMCIIFTYVDVENMENIVREFERRYRKVTRSECSAITWIPENYFFDIIKTGKVVYEDGFCYSQVYKIVSDLLRSVSNINEIV
jgi:(2Fe-2S) ferredoxin